MDSPACSSVAPLGFFMVTLLVPTVALLLAMAFITLDGIAQDGLEQWFLWRPWVLGWLPSKKKK